jgi:hypothetical protein
LNIDVESVQMPTLKIEVFFATGNPLSFTHANGTWTHDGGNGVLQQQPVDGVVGVRMHLPEYDTLTLPHFPLRSIWGDKNTVIPYGRVGRPPKNDGGDNDWCIWLGLENPFTVEEHAGGILGQKFWTWQMLRIELHASTKERLLSIRGGSFWGDWDHNHSDPSLLNCTEF